MRGFIITFDASIALLFLFIAGIIMATLIFYPTAPRGVYLKQVSLDVITILEKTERLDGILEGNATGIHEILMATPEAICMQISIIDAGEELAVIGKLNCGSYEKELQTVTRVFVHDGNSYYAKVESWYRND